MSSEMIQKLIIEFSNDIIERVKPYVNNIDELRKQITQQVTQYVSDTKQYSLMLWKKNIKTLHDRIQGLLKEHLHTPLDNTVLSFITEKATGLSQALASSTKTIGDTISNIITSGDCSKENIIERSLAYVSNSVQSSHAYVSNSVQSSQAYISNSVQSSQRRVINIFLEDLSELNALRIKEDTSNDSENEVTSDPKNNNCN